MIRDRLFFVKKPYELVDKDWLKKRSSKNQKKKNLTHERKPFLLLSKKESFHEIKSKEKNP